MRGPLPYPNIAPSRGAAIMLAIVLTAAVTACTPKAPTRPSGAAAQTIRITGAGSTLDALFFDQAFPAYQQSHPGVTVSYAATGSGDGVARFTTGQVDFAATDIPASRGALAARGGPVIEVPVDLGAVSVAYNVLTLNAAPLKLTGPVLARIFLGHITRWNDPAITALNPGAGLPDAYITVVHRSDGNGTTYIFSTYLSSASPAWASAVGTGRSLRWPTGYAAGGNRGVVTAINRTPYSIGYVERPSTPGIAPGSAAIANRDGKFVTPTAGAIAAAAATKLVITPQDFSIIDEPGPAAYPISTYSWVLISEHQPSRRAGHALVGLISWLTQAGQSHAATLGYAPLPSAVRHYAAAALARLTGPAGKRFAR